RCASRRAAALPFRGAGAVVVAMVAALPLRPQRRFPLQLARCNNGKTMPDQGFARRHGMCEPVSTIYHRARPPPAAGALWRPRPSGTIRLPWLLTALLGLPPPLSPCGSLPGGGHNDAKLAMDACGSDSVGCRPRLRRVPHIPNRADLLE